MIWFPTFTSLGFWRGARKPERGGGRLVSESGEVLPEVVQIIEMAAAKKVGIGFGHTDFQELLPLAKKAPSKTAPSKTAEATMWRTHLPCSRRIVAESGTKSVRLAESMTLVI